MLLWITKYRNRELGLFTIASFISLLPYFGPAFFHGQILDGFIYLFTFFLTTGFSANFYSRPPQELWKGSTFHGVRKPEGDEVWLRRSDADLVVASLSSPASDFHVLCGASGSGKSVLISSQVQRKLQLLDSELTIWFEDSYSKVNNMIERLRSDIQHKQGRPKILILDQSEQLVNLEIEEQQLMIEFIDWCGHSGVKCLAIVRDDYFYQLRFLGDLMPSPAKTIHLQGMNRNNKQDFAPILKQLSTVAMEDCIEAVLADLQRSNSKLKAGISPLEIQIVGTMLEKYYREKGFRITLQYYREEIRSIDELIKEFFSMHIKASPHPIVSQSILYALSIEGRIRYALSRQRLKSAIYQGGEVFDEVIAFFLDKKLIVEHSNYQYEWLHDQLAERFREYAASEMAPEIRDNISYCVLSYKEPTPTRVALSDESTIKRRNLWSVVLMLLSIGTILRCFASDWPGWYLLGRLTTGWITAHQEVYPFAAAAHLVGAFYVVRLEQELFARLQPRLLFFPVPLCAVIGLVLMAGTWFAPTLWISAIGAMAVVLGCDRLWITHKLRLPAQAAWRLSRPGFLTLAGGILTVVIGLIYAILVLPRSGNSDMKACTIAAVVGTFFIVGWGVRHHIAAQSIEAVLGTVDRASTTR